MATYRDLLKYAATGQASPSMTYYDRMRASTLMGGAVQTLTGIPPLSFKSNGKPLISWSMLGNGQQTGTPTPDNPVMPEFVGTKTAQMIPYPYELPTTETSGITFSVDSDGRITATGRTTAALTAIIRRNIGMLTAGTYTFSVTGKHEGLISYVRDMEAKATIANILSGSTSTSTTFTLAENTSNEIRVYMTRSAGYDVDFDCTVQLETGSKATEHEPYGYKIPLTCAGQTVPVYLGQTQTVRRVKKLVLTGEEAIAAYDPTYSRFSITIQDSLIVSVRLSPAICTHYQVISDGRSIANVPNNAIYSDSGNGRWFIKTTEYTTVDDFKAYLAAQYAAGTPVTVWYVLAEPETGIINEPLCKIGDYADELHSTDAGVSIPTVKGNNTLTVDTELQPSEMTITFKG